MVFRSSIATAFVFHAVFGSFCTMPMAYGASMPMQHDKAMEISLTPMVPMTPAHCKQCTHVTPQTSVPMNSGCTGHCLAKAHDTVSTVAPVSTIEHIAAMFTSTVPTLLALADVLQREATAMSPPPYLALAGNIVLTL